MQTFAALTTRDDQPGFLKQVQMLGDSLPAHRHALAQLQQSQTAANPEPVEDASPSRVGQRLEEQVGRRLDIMIQ